MHTQLEILWVKGWAIWYIFLSSHCFLILIFIFLINYLRICLFCISLYLCLLLYLKRAFHIYLDTLSPEESNGDTIKAIKALCKNSQSMHMEMQTKKCRTKGSFFHSYAEIKLSVSSGHVKHLSMILVWPFCDIFGGIH